MVQEPNEILSDIWDHHDRHIIKFRHKWARIDSPKQVRCTLPDDHIDCIFDVLKGISPTLISLINLVRGQGSLHFEVISKWRICNDLSSISLCFHKNYKLSTE